MSTTFYYVVVNYIQGRNPVFMNAENKKITITSEYITLGQLLKFTHVIATGSQEKSYLLSHQVLVNGVSEQRRGRKLYPGDKITLDQGGFEIAK